MKSFEKLSRNEMRSVTGGLLPPGDCTDGCGAGVACPPLSPYCLDSNCTGKDGKTVSVKACSPTQEP